MALPEDYNEIITKNPRYENIAGQGFHTDPSRIHNTGRPKGSRNRATIVREALEAVDALSGLPNVDAITYAAVKKALTGDIGAFKELMDSGFGKVPDKQIEVKPDAQDDDFTKQVLDSMTKEQIEALLASKSANTGE